ncbi:enoyl-CoA delta isomerase 1, mitochondrial-like [Ctenocephalides felis]|uniref:enoyl-CoA delta isomerase 1, mitochondrial-like n=1 Tax=Ctenocephalides felis TaxID=7515 RepID=UPI000E6E5255|nr:enoyl-CoA delta isomerase 1, mitochondrial-like [Ctenocephalides felis]
MFRLMNSIRCLSNGLARRKFSSNAEKFVDLAVNEQTGFATITMQRLPVNSLNLELLTQLSDSFDQVEENKCRGMILTSASNKVFSAGLDITEMYKPNDDRLKAFWSKLQEVWLKLYGSSYPTVAAINGHSPAGGCLLALSCEYRVMVNAFTIGLNETQLGIVAPTWFQASMRNVLSKRDSELALTTGRMFTTEEALKAGLIDEVANDKADALARAEQFLLRFKRVSPQARTITKLALRAEDLKALEENRDQDVQLFVFAVKDPKVQKGLGVYMESLKTKK